jgi:trk system potassium uptake protein TrkH
VRGFVAFLAVSSVLTAYWLYEEKGIGFGQALTLTSFNITSVVTTTGFASDDYTLWGPGAVGVFLVLMFVGGCSGSTSGAIKIYRHQILYMIVRAHVKRLFSPSRVITLRYNGRRLPDDVPYSILAFLAVFVATIAVFTVCLALMGLDIVTAYSASVTAITNVGPGLGSIVGPAGNFAPLPDAAKWLLTFAMLAGRLEVLALLVAFDRDFWRF